MFSETETLANLWAGGDFIPSDIGVVVLMLDLCPKQLPPIVEPEPTPEPEPVPEPMPEPEPIEPVVEKDTTYDWIWLTCGLLIIIATGVTATVFAVRKARNYKADRKFHVIPDELSTINKRRLSHQLNLVVKVGSTPNFCLM